MTIVTGECVKKLDGSGSVTNPGRYAAINLVEHYASVTGRKRPAAEGGLCLEVSE